VSNSSPNYLSYEKLLKKSENIILVGDPGSGKTTTLQKITLDLFNESFDNKYNFVPVVLRIRKLVKNYHKNLFQLLIEYFGIDLKFESFYRKSLKKSKKFERVDEEEEYKIEINAGLELIKKLNLVLIIDGFDETSNTTFKDNLFNDLEQISLSFTERKFFISSRPPDFTSAIKNAHELQIVELSKEQIIESIEKRYKSAGDREYLKQRLLTTNYLDTLTRPLNISQIFMLYDQSHRIPPKPISIYKRLIELFLEKWDEERGINRKSKYSNFQPNEKFDFLCRLAYSLTIDFEVKIFTKQHLESCYIKLHEEFQLPKKEMSNVIDEIESHTGIFIQSGIDEFEFSHLTFQEYLTAEVISRSLSALEEQYYVLRNLPNELAIACSLNFRPNQFIYEIIYNIESWDNIIHLNTFFKRLIAEKPNYTRNPLLAYSLIRLYHYWAEDLKSQKADLKYLSHLFNDKTLNPSFKEFNKYYPVEKKEIIRKRKTYHLVKENAIIRKTIEPMPNFVIVNISLLKKIKQKVNAL